MKTFKLTIAYDGTRYKGWQRLKQGGDTIQEKLEACLSRMTGAKIEVIGSGRTDAGAHALGQVASFQTRADFTGKQIAEYCYQYLPEDIVVLSAEEAELRFHARYLAKEKTYLYRICNAERHDVFLRKYAWHIPQALDLDAMKKTLRVLMGEHDFRSFTSLKSEEKSTVRTLIAADIKRQGALVEIRFNADGFLYNMVRILAGTLVELGLGKTGPDDVKQMLAARQRSAAGPMAPPHGLFLADVRY